MRLPSDMVMAISNAHGTMIVSAVGFSMALSPSGKDVNLVNVLYLATAKSHQKRRLATTLFHHIEQRLTPRRDLPLMAIHAAVAPVNTSTSLGSNVHPFYKSIGAVELTSATKSLITRCFPFVVAARNSGTICLALWPADDSSESESESDSSNIDEEPEGTVSKCKPQPRSVDKCCRGYPGCRGGHAREHCAACKKEHCLQR